MFGKKKVEGLYESLYKQQKIYVKGLEEDLISLANMVNSLLNLCNKKDVDIGKYQNKLKKMNGLDQLLIDRELEKGG